MSGAKRLDLQLLVTVSALLAAHIVGWQIGGYYTWGFGIWYGLPFWILVISVTLVIGLFSLPIDTSSVSRSVVHNILQDKQIPPPRIKLRRITTTLILIVLCLIIYSIRSRSLLYGDGYAAVAAVQRDWGVLFHSVHEWLKPLSIALYKLNYEILTTLFKIEPATSFAICSSVGGALGLLGTLRLAKTLSADPNGRMFLFASALTSGSILLFCGHIEFYVWGVAAFVWFLAFAHAPEQSRSTPALLLTGIAAILSNLMLFPAIVASFSLAWKHIFPSVIQRYLRLGPILTLSLASSILLAFALQWFARSYGTVAIVPYARNPYWVLSINHLSDMLNALLFACPLIPMLVLPGKGRSFLREYPILVVCVFLIWVVGFWIDPDAGAARDWDLLSQFGIPLTLLCALSVLHGIKSTDVPRLVVPMLCLATFLNLPYIYEKIDRTRAVERLNAVLLNDPHYQTSYLSGTRTISWGALLYNEEGRGDLAEPFFRRRILADPTAALAYANLGNIFLESKRYDSAEVYLGRASELDSGNQFYRVQYLNSLLFQEKWGELASLLLRFETTDSTYVSALHQCGRELFSLGKIAEALACFHKLDSLRMGSIYYKLSLAMSYARLCDESRSLVYFAHADSLSPDSLKCQLFTVSIRNLISFEEPAIARKLLPRYREVCSVVDPILVEALLTK